MEPQIRSDWWWIEIFSWRWEEERGKNAIIANLIFERGGERHGPRPSQLGSWKGVLRLPPLDTWERNAKELLPPSFGFGPRV